MNAPTMLLLGSGAREHALAWKLRHDGATVFVAPGNAGIPGSQSELSATDFPALEAFCKTHEIRLIVVGPEAPLAAGVADYFAGSEIRVFGPTRAAARLESSKVFSKDFMRRHGVATAEAWVFERHQAADAQAKITELNGEVVVKYDGLAAGKGVYVCASVAEAEAAVTELLSLHEGDFCFLLEEKLTGPEVSLMGLTDGHTLRLLASSQDHKQLLAHDEGPNTGGMGAYCPVEFLTDDWQAAIERDIIGPTLRGLQAEPFDFLGFLYFGVMLTPRGPKLLEYNVRLGDPEAEVILPALASSLLALIKAALVGRLAEPEVRQRPGAFVGVVLASGGYPAAGFPTGFPISGEKQLSPGTLAFAGGVQAGDAPGALRTAGGRVGVVVAHGPDLAEAMRRVYEEVEKVDFEGKYVRSDIGQRVAPRLAPFPENPIPLAPFPDGEGGTSSSSRADVRLETRASPPSPSGKGLEDRLTKQDDQLTKPARLAILLSGRGSNMLALADAVRDGALKSIAEIALVFANDPAAPGLEAAAARGLPTAALPSKGRERAAFDQEVTELLQAYRPDFIVLAGYMRVLSPGFVRAFAGRIVNIHPADTHQHRGLHAYEWAFDNQLKETKITVHLVDEGLDTGPILAQRTVNLEGASTLAEVQRRGLVVEHELYAETLASLIQLKISN